LGHTSKISKGLALLFRRKKKLASLELVLSLPHYVTEESWAAALYTISAQCGFNYILYGVVPNKYSPLENAFLKSNYPSRWRTIYDEKKMHYIDPTVSHCSNSVLPIIWKPEIFSNPDQKMLYEEASSYGLRFGVSYPAHGSKGEFGILSFVTDQEFNGKSLTNPDQNFANLAFIRDYVFESSLKFLASADNYLTPVKLTTRELECLAWVMEGKSSWEISQILACSESTVNFHITNIKTKFNVHTRQQAVLKAIKQGLLVPP
jgi:LuxR family quorum-sensing transcriptional regulator LasR